MPMQTILTYPLVAGYNSKAFHSEVLPSWKREACVSLYFNILVQIISY